MFESHNYLLNSDLKNSDYSFSFNPFLSEIEDEHFNYSPPFNIINPIVSDDSFENNIEQTFIQNNENKIIENIKEDKKANSIEKDKISKIKTNINTNNNTNNNTKIFQIKKINKRLGRKKNSGGCNYKIKESQTKWHDKTFKDNMTRKLKTKLFEDILFIINNSLKEEEEEEKENFGKKILKYNYTKKFLLKIDTNIKTNTNALYNRRLLITKIKDIFSNGISANCIRTNKFRLDYNKKYIEKIYKDNIKTKTIAILEKTMLACLEHYRGSKYYDELRGLENRYIDFINEMKQEKEYIDEFKKFVNCFENYYNSKIPRIEGKKKKFNIRKKIFTSIK